MRQYDFIFLTNLPAFYKINLFNEIAQTCKTLAIFTGEAIENRNADFYKGEKHFDVEWLQGGAFEQCFQLFRLMRNLQCKRFVIGGWDRPVMLLAPWLSSRRKNGCIVESSIYESSTKGAKAFLKRMFLKRIDTAFPSGKLQAELVSALGFKGHIVQYGGCGILNYQTQPPYEERKRVANFVYVGRLSPEKNLPLLLEAFRTLPQLMLTIIGFGPLEGKLKAIAPPNVQFTGAIDNEKLPRYYQQNDVFILPSKSETWGLVVEEALNNGCPVIVSDRVGCKDDLVSDDTGLVFRYDSVSSLREAVLKMTDIAFYNRLRNGVAKLDFRKRAQRQVSAFVNTL